MPDFGTSELLYYSTVVELVISNQNSNSDNQSFIHIKSNIHTYMYYLCYVIGVIMFSSIAKIV